MRDASTTAARGFAKPASASDRLWSLPPGDAGALTPQAAADGVPAAIAEHADNPALTLRSAPSVELLCFVCEPGRPGEIYYRRAALPVGEIRADARSHLMTKILASEPAVRVVNLFDMNVLPHHLFFASAWYAGDGSVAASEVFLHRKARSAGAWLEMVHQYRAEQRGN